MSDRKTKSTNDDVDSFLAAVDSERRRADAIEVNDLIGRVTGVEPKLWGTIVGYGRQPYATADKVEREYFAVGLAPRKAALTLYGLTYEESNNDLLEKLGKHTTGKGCLYIKKLEDVDTQILAELIERSWAANHVPDS